MNHPKDKPNQVLPKLYLGIVDFDSAIYRCAAVHEDDVDGLDDAKLTLMRFVQENVVNPLNCMEYVFIVTGEYNFRHAIAVSKPYKGQRKIEKPIHFLPLFEWAIEHFNCAITNTVEADDWAVNLHQKYQGTSVLVGIDKDNLQSSGWHYNFVTNIGKFITQEEAQWCLAYQLLVGDPGDNIPGLVGVGAAKAAKLFEASPDLPPMMVAYQAYKEKGLLKEYYKEQYRLLYMLRDDVVDFETSFIKLEAVTEFEDSAMSDEDFVRLPEVKL